MNKQIKINWKLMSSLITLTSIIIFLLLSHKISTLQTQFNEINSKTLEEQEQQNTLEEYQQFDRIRLLSSLRSLVFYSKSYMLLGTENDELFEELSLIAEEAFTQKSITSNQNMKELIVYAKDLFDKSFLMYKDKVNLENYDHIDYLEGCDSYIQQAMNLVGMNYFRIAPEYVHGLLDLSEDEETYELIKNNVLRQVSNILEEGITAKETTFSYENQIEMLINLLSYSQAMEIQSFNWSSAIIPPTSKEEEWKLISSKLFECLEVFSRYLESDSWLTRTECAQLELDYTITFGEILNEIETIYGITPSDSPIEIPEGIYYVDDLGQFREADITDKFYVKDGENGYRETTQEDYKSNLQLYKKDENDNYYPIDREESPITQ